MFEMTQDQNERTDTPEFEGEVIGDLGLLNPFEMLFLRGYISGYITNNKDASNYWVQVKLIEERELQIRFFDPAPSLANPIAVSVFPVSREAPPQDVELDDGFPSNLLRHLNGEPEEGQA